MHSNTTPNRRTRCRLPSGAAGAAWGADARGGGRLAFPRVPDVVFRLGAAGWMVRHGRAGVLDVYQYAQLDGPLAYPGGFHAVVAALAPFTGLPVTATWHALLIVTVGVVWPFGVMPVSYTHLTLPTSDPV